MESTGITIAALIAFSSVIIGFARSIKTFLVNCTKYIFGTMSCDPYLAGAVFSYCNAHMKKMPFRPRTFLGYHGRASGENKSLVFDALDKNTVIYRRWFCVAIISPGEWTIDDGGDWKRGIYLSLPRFMWNAEKFIKTACAYYDEHNLSKNRNHRFNITRFYGQPPAEKSALVLAEPNKRPDSRPSAVTQAVRDVRIGIKAIINEEVDAVEVDSFKENPFEFFPFPPEIKEAHKEAIWWLQRKNWYENKGIPWRRGWLLHGKPGCGKSFFIKCIAIDLDLPIFSFDLSSMSNEELYKFWNQAAVDTPCIIVLEDFDNCFHGRKNQARENGGITFDALLNCISGIQCFDGIFLIITTNDMSKIDPAIGAVGEMSSRPGRIDRVIEMAEMNTDCKLKFAQYIFDGNRSLMDEAMKRSDGMTAAQFTELCRSIVIKREMTDMPKYRVVEPKRTVKIKSLVGGKA